MNPNDVTMTFGKHKGWKVGAIPLDYCDWAYHNVDWGKRGKPTYLKEAFGARLGIKPQTQAPPRNNEILINQWYRQLCIEFHPDRTGGSRVPMQVLGRAKELLEETLGR